MKTSAEPAPTPRTKIVRNDLTLDEVRRASPFYRRVTWQNLIALINEADRVAVSFNAYASNLVKEEAIGRAMEIPKDVALTRSIDGVRWHADKPEFVNVTAAGGTLYFGG